MIPWNTLLVNKRKASKLSAREWNQLKLMASVKDYHSSGYDFVVARGVVARHSTSGVTATWMQITAVAGLVPPFHYSAVEVYPSAINAVFANKPGGAVLNGTLRNVGEVAYPGAGKLNIGRVVVAWKGFGDEWLCDVLNYRGVYPGP